MSRLLHRINRADGKTAAWLVMIIVMLGLAVILVLYSVTGFDFYGIGESLDGVWTALMG